MYPGKAESPVARTVTAPGYKILNRTNSPTFQPVVTRSILTIVDIPFCQALGRTGRCVGAQCSLTAARLSSAAPLDTSRGTLGERRIGTTRFVAGCTEANRPSLKGGPPLYSAGRPSLDPFTPVMGSPGTAIPKHLFIVISGSVNQLLIRLLPYPHRAS